jgi:hypothetical protein
VTVIGNKFFPSGRVLFGGARFFFTGLDAPAAKMMADGHGQRVGGIKIPGLVG